MEVIKITNSNKEKEILIGMRIPKDYFITTGKGESNITIHAGSYHLALKDAGIEMCNIMTYSSIMPGISKEIKRPKIITPGSVMETISAVATSKKGKRATAGIMVGWLYNKKTKSKFGGLVCEYHGNKTIEGVKKELTSSLYEIYNNGFSEKYDIKDIDYNYKTIIPKKKYGTSIVAICFINYIVPIIK
jgi:arginine decarboxylase